MEIVREVRLSDQDRLALQRSMDIINQLADELRMDVESVFKNIELACRCDIDDSYNVPSELEMEIFD